VDSPVEIRQGLVESQYDSIIRRWARGIGYAAGGRRH
jgi:hypothetical protein